MAIKILSFIPVLIGLFALYHYLQPASEEHIYSELQSEEEKEIEEKEVEADNENGAELKTLMSDSQ